MSREIARQRSRSLVGRKSTPGTLLLILKTVSETPVIGHVVKCAGIARSTLEYWIEKSKRGVEGDGFDLTISGETRRFHEWFQDAVETGKDRVRKAVWDAALGEGKHGTEIGTYQGRVVYQEDPDLIKLGALRGTSAAWLRDERGNPVPVSWAKADLETLRWLLERIDPENFGRKESIEHLHKGGVLVVGAKLSSADLEKLYGGQQEIVDVTFEDVDDDGEGEESLTE